MQTANCICQRYWDGTAVCLIQVLHPNSIEDASAETRVWLFPWGLNSDKSFNSQKKLNPPRIKYTSIFIYWNSIGPVKHQDAEEQIMKNKTCKTQRLLSVESEQAGKQNGSWNSLQSTRGIYPQTPRHPQSLEQAVPQFPLVSLDCSNIYYQRAADCSNLSVFP